MTGAASAQNGQPGQKRLREERYFDVHPDKALPLVKAAVEHATGVELVELVDGMWEGQLPLASGYREVTVVAQPTERGLNIILNLEDHASIVSSTLWGLLAVVLSIFIVPLFFILAYSQRRGAESSKARMIQMHKAWKELTGALGAPMRASYRDAPRRIYAPAEHDLQAEREVIAHEEEVRDTAARDAAEQTAEAQPNARV